VTLANLFIILLSKAQGRALGKLYHLKTAATPADLKESRNTLDSLVRMGFAAYQPQLGGEHSANFMRHCTYYQITIEGHEAYPSVDVPA
jgi:hypothetical protein